MADFILCTRKLRRGEFIAEPGPARYLRTRAGATPEPGDSIPRKTWLDDIIAAAHTHQDPHTGENCGDILVFVHGFNTSSAELIERHREFHSGLRNEGFAGAFLSFDWPSDDRALNYLEDRSDAKYTALTLVGDGIAMLAATQFRNCKMNLHVVAHSMGAYVVREAFDDADDRPAIAATNWTVSQLCLVAADVSSRSLDANDARSSSLYRHCNRLTNYQNPYDAALKLSDIKRIGVAPRAGRRGLPDKIPAHAINVDCGEHYDERYSDRDDNSHSWYFADPVFLRDLAETLAGNHDRRVTGRRRSDAEGALHLK
jgi:esterase/lipase superfamily enzyme